MTDDDVLALLLTLEDHYDEPHDGDREARWVRALAEASARDIEAAARGYMTDEPRWFPKPAQLLAMIPERRGSNVPPPRSTRPAGEFPGYVIPDMGGVWMVPKDGQIPPRVLQILAAERCKRPDFAGDPT